MNTIKAIIDHNPIFLVFFLLLSISLDSSNPAIYNFFILKLWQTSKIIKDNSTIRLRRENIFKIIVALWRGVKSSKLSLLFAASQKSIGKIVNNNSKE